MFVISIGLYLVDIRSICAPHSMFSGEQCKVRWKSMVYIANIGPSKHEAIGNVVGAGRRGTSDRKCQPLIRQAGFLPFAVSKVHDI